MLITFLHLSAPRQLVNATNRHGSPFPCLLLLTRFSSRGACWFLTVSRAGLAGWFPYSRWSRPSHCPSILLSTAGKSINWTS
ncbi:MAG: hypothetical protein ACXADA_22260 [Candidatus Hodarchaeales archaeon]